LIRFLRGSITNQGLHFAAQKPDHKSSPISLVSTFFDYFSIFYTFITKAIRKYINYLNLIAEWHINGSGLGVRTNNSAGIYRHEHQEGMTPSPC
jgi:hypothetical protein